jgi:hypothetical protein
MGKLFSTFSFLFIFSILAGCGGSENASSSYHPAGTDKNIHFFKATGGSHAYITPFVGVRLYDNNAFVYAFRRGCEEDKNKALEKVSISWSGKPITESPRMGGIGQWNGRCSFDASFMFENNALKVIGKFNNVENGLDILMTAVGQSEFFQGVKDFTSGKGVNYRFFPRDDREDFEKTCLDLTGTACDQLL